MKNQNDEFDFIPKELSKAALYFGLKAALH